MTATKENSEVKKPRIAKYIQILITISGAIVIITNELQSPFLEVVTKIVVFLFLILLVGLLDLFIRMENKVNVIIARIFTIIMLIFFIITLSIAFFPIISCPFYDNIYVDKLNFQKAPICSDTKCASKQLKLPTILSGGLLSHFSFDGNLDNAVTGTSNAIPENIEQGDYDCSKFFKALKIDNEEKWIEIPNELASLNNDRTIVLFTKLHSLPAQNEGVILGKSSSNGYRLVVDNNDLILRVKDTSNQNYRETKLTIDQGVWTFIAITKTDDTVFLYRDSEKSEPINITDKFERNSGNLIVSADGTPHREGKNVNIEIDEMMIFSKALDTSEVESLYQFMTDN